MSPLQALWLATETVHYETGSYGSPQDTYFVQNFLDLSVAITPELATRIASIPIANFAVGTLPDLNSCWQSIETRLRKKLRAPSTWDNIQLIGDLSQAIHHAATRP